MKINLNVGAKSNPPQTIREHTDELLKRLDVLIKYGYITDKHLEYLIKQACEFHDYGKVNKSFQNRLINNTKFNEKEELPHNVLSTFFVPSGLFESREDYSVVLNAVLKHHAHTDNWRIFCEENNRIEKALEDFEIEKPSKRIKMKITQVQDTYNGIMTKGILHKCDYAASAGIVIEYKNDFMNDAMDRLLDKWKVKSTNSQWNLMQNFCRTYQDRNLIITAPTGMGKTEASLLWLGNNKGFYVLPLRTAINAIFDRIAQTIVEEHVEERVALIHSESFAHLMEVEYSKTMDLLSYLSEGRKFSMPLSVCTPDQIFNFVFKYTGYELKLATLSYSKVIIDEIQSYQPELLAYIIYGLHKIVEYGGKFAIFTATLPPFIIDLIQAPYDEHAMPFMKQDFSKEARSVRHSLKVLDEEISANIIGEHFHENGKKKTLVVCNTVKQCQNIYMELREMLGEEYVAILHAKFIRKERAEKEIKILSDGRTYLQQGELYHKEIIWVTTQLVEASLDIDFDYIFTQLSDLNGLFQRLGRCNRKGVKKIDDYNSFVFTQMNPKWLIEKNRGNGFIDGEIFRLSKTAISTVDGELSEINKQEILERTLTLRNLQGSPFLAEYKEKYAYLQDLFVNDMDKNDVDKRFRRILSQMVIPKSIYEKNKEQINELERVLSEKSKSKQNDYKSFIMKKQQAKNMITSYCVSVRQYDINNSETIKIIKLGKLEFVSVVDCIYDELGFRSGTNMKATTQKTKKQESGLFL